MQDTKALWERTFSDTPKYRDYYFEKKAPRSRVYKKYEGAELASMMFFSPYDIFYQGEVVTGEYIVGVATEEKFRRQGKMSQLMQKAIQTEKECQVDLIFLCPENPAVYESLGFVPMYWRETTYYEVRDDYKDSKGVEVISWNELNSQKKEIVCEFVDRMLRNEKFDLYVCHTKEYMDRVEEELQALDGELIVVEKDGQIIAVANVILEENEHEITEFICQPNYAKEALEAIMARKETTIITIDDSYFLSELRGANVTRMKQKKPYIMARYTDGRPIEKMRCYINDIT